MRENAGVTELNSLTITIHVPVPSDRGVTVQVRPVVDGRDIIAEFFDVNGRTFAPESLFAQPSPLRADAEPREVRLVEADCTEGCCGALYVTIRRQGSQVVWDSWRNPHELDEEPPVLRFDADQYDREVARAGQDHTWEWPARTVARLVTSRLRAEPDSLARWDCELFWASGWHWDRDHITVSVMSPRRPRSVGERWVQFRVALAVTDEVPEDQADRLVAQLTNSDPRAISEICGGSAPSRSAPPG